MSYDNTNRGVLFKNDKQGNEKAPDYKGTVNVAGKEMELAAWIRVSGKGTKFMSLSVSEKRKQDGPRQDAPKQDRGAPEDVDVPF